jgi:signal transduction histidine kinase
VLKVTGVTRRTTLLAWTVTLATLGIFVAIIIPEQKRDLRAELESKANGVAVALRGEVAEAAVSEDYSSVVDHAMQVLAGDKDVEFLVITKNDGFSLVVQRDGWRMQPDSDHYWYPNIRKPSSDLGRVPMFNKRLFHFAVPFDYSGIEWGWIHVGLSLNSYDRSTQPIYLRTGFLAVACVLLSLVASVSYAGHFVRPILQLQSAVERVTSGDFTARAEIQSRDEIEQLANSFNSMAEAILHRDQELSEARRDLERRVTERTKELREQIVARDVAHAELAEAQKRLIEASRLSGMAEIATGILHNVGNVLNSVNVSATIVGDRLRDLRVGQLKELVRLLQEHRQEIGEFLTNDSRGQRILPYMDNLARHLESERDELNQEMQGLTQHVTHVKEIVSMQQTYARASGVFEKVDPVDLVKDVFKISWAAMQHYDIAVQTEFADLPPITTDRHKALQILLNLVRNAQDSLKVPAKIAASGLVRLSMPAPRLLRSESTSGL